jgi:hypothetical protein
MSRRRNGLSMNPAGQTPARIWYHKGKELAKISIGNLAHEGVANFDFVFVDPDVEKVIFLRLRQAF